MAETVNAAVAQATREAAEGAERRGPFRPERLVTTRSRVNGRNLERAFRLVDGLVVGALAWFTLDLLTFRSLFAASLGSVMPYMVGVALMLWSLHAIRAYRFGRRETLATHLVRVAAAGGLTATAAVAALTPFMGLAGVGETLGLWFATAFSGVYLLHILWWMTVNRWREAGRLIPNVVIVGATRNAERLVEKALASGEVAVLGVFYDRGGRAPGHVRGVPVLGSVDHLVGHKVMPFVDKVIIAVPSNAQHRVRELIDRLSVLPNPVTLFIDIDGEGQAATMARIADSPLAYVSGSPQDDGGVLLKRAQDLVVGALALVAALPIMAAVALAVRLDSPGPILFRQKRHGFNNEEIVVWKFRSMRADAADSQAKRQVSADDDRVTAVGRFIRRTSLDELPQIFNVLKGEMSLVGPRPHAIGMMTGGEESARLVAEYAHRHRMKPGMTGWAAIKGSRGPVDTPDLVRRRVALDIEYIERQSIWLDLYIMALTIPCLLGDKSAVR